MRTSTLINNGLKHYWRTNLAVILGVATAVAVLAGALLVGDSVRASLRDLALARLGQTDFVVTSSGFFREQLADDLQSHDQFVANFDGACPIIALEGVVTRDENNARAGGAQVYGVDERFWKFHGANAQTPGENDALISPSLAQELGAKPGDTIILRIEKHSDIPTESLHGRKDDLGRTIRLTVGEALPAASLGEFSLRPQQGAVRAIFVSLQKLQKNLEQEGKANAVLLAAKDANGASAQAILKDKFALADLGLRLRPLEQQQCVSLESDSAIISDALAEKARIAAASSNSYTRSFLTYLANTIRIGQREIPYSLVTAIEIAKAEDERSERMLWEDESPTPPILLNKWAGEDLGAKAGDEVELDYYLWQESGQLVTKTARFRLVAVVSADGFTDDRNFAPEYPGITEAESLADWDPPFPIDLSRVRQEDEDYWQA